uniref:Cell cycle checkpoint control protein RAD9A n=1 Tax=Sphenodon punctatus TaxID=8508 RepID=A0A8D0L812_SPHPU
YKLVLKIFILFLYIKCISHPSCPQVFGRAIHALARISDEFWFDPTEKGLALKSVNSSMSAYACIFFSSMFFQHYCRTAMTILHSLLQSVLPVFRCLNTLERNVEKCSVYTNLNECYVVFQLFCRHGIVKTHNLAFQECEPLQAVFARHMCPNVLKVQSRVLSDMMIHFPTYQEEVTLAVTPIQVCFKSYSEEEMADFPKAMHTKIHLNPGEFDYFQVGVDSEITFCLKELRKTVPPTFSPKVHTQHRHLPVAFFMEDMMVEASFVLATLADIEDRTSSQQSAFNNSLEYSISQFHSLFFGAVSSKQQDVLHAFHSLATASDTDEDFENGQLSQTF